MNVQYIHICPLTYSMYVYFHCVLVFFISDSSHVMCTMCIVMVSCCMSTRLSVQVVRKRMEAVKMEKKLLIHPQQV